MIDKERALSDTLASLGSVIVAYSDEHSPEMLRNFALASQSTRSFDQAFGRRERLCGACRPNDGE